jgi:hypothetical protein
MKFKELIALLASAAALTAFAFACGKDDQPVADAGPDAPKAGCTTMIADDHVHAPHMVVVTSGEVQTAAEKIYDIKGAASHTHTITVTAAQFMMLQTAGSMIMVTSTDSNGTHVVTISC